MELKGIKVKFKLWSQLIQKIFLPIIVKYAMRLWPYTKKCMTPLWSVPIQY